MADASRYLLRNRLVVTLAAGASTSIPHGLKVAGAGVVPSDVTPDRATPIVATSANVATILFTNPSTAAQTAVFYALYVWSGQADAEALESNLWQGAASGGGGGGGSGTEVVGRNDAVDTATINEEDGEVQIASVLSPSTEGNPHAAMLSATFNCVTGDADTSITVTIRRVSDSTALVSAEQALRAIEVGHPTPYNVITIAAVDPVGAPGEEWELVASVSGGQVVTGGGLSAFSVLTGTDV